jgi:hypothetical protein
MEVRYLQLLNSYRDIYLDKEEEESPNIFKVYFNVVTRIDQTQYIIF